MIIHPHVTEKATMLAEQNNLLQFIVGVDDTKIKVKKRDRGSL